MNIKTPNGDKPITLRHIVVTLTILTLLAGVYGFVHAWIVVPQIMDKVSEYVHEEVDRHSRMNHRTAVSREELKILVLDRLSQLATKDQVDALEKRLDRIEERLGR